MEELGMVVDEWVNAAVEVAETDGDVQYELRNEP